MKRHIGRLAIGGTILTAAFAGVWLAQATMPYSRDVFIVAVILAAAYLIGAIVVELTGLP